MTQYEYILRERRGFLGKCIAPRPQHVHGDTEYPKPDPRHTRQQTNLTHAPVVPRGVASVVMRPRPLQKNEQEFLKITTLGKSDEKAHEASCEDRFRVSARKILGERPAVRDARSRRCSMVKTYVNSICLLDGTEDEYRAYHADCWPAVVKSLSAVGITDMHIYLKSCQGNATRLVMVMKTIDAFDPAVDFPRHASSSPVVMEWEARMKAFQVPPVEATRGEWWSSMEEVFDLSKQLESADSGRRGYKIPE